MLGVTQGESPAMRRLFRALATKVSMQDCVFATAMIRPVAMSGRQKGGHVSGLVTRSSTGQHCVRR